MSNVDFDTDQYSRPQFTSRTILGQPQRPGMVGWLMRMGIIKDESKAGGLLVGIVITCIVLSVIVLMRSGSFSIHSDRPDYLPPSGTINSGTYH